MLFNAGVAISLFVGFFVTGDMQFLVAGGLFWIAAYQAAILKELRIANTED